MELTRRSLFGIFAATPAIASIAPSPAPRKAAIGGAPDEYLVTGRPASGKTKLVLRLTLDAARVGGARYRAMIFVPHWKLAEVFSDRLLAMAPKGRLTRHNNTVMLPSGARISFMSISSIESAVGVEFADMAFDGCAPENHTDYFRVLSTVRSREHLCRVLVTARTDSELPNWARERLRTKYVVRL